MEHYSSKLLHIRNVSDASLKKLMQELGAAGLEDVWQNHNIVPQTRIH